MTQRRSRATPAADEDSLGLFADSVPAPSIPPARAPTAYPGETSASAISITTLTRTARDVIEGAFTPLWVRGEVSDFKAHRNGHWYFGLRDAQSQIRCVVWASDTRRIPAPPDDGMRITALGQLTVYAARGDMQLQVLGMEAEGDGLRQKALERTRLALAKDGLLDQSRKRALPPFPRVVAIITSQDGAALHDIVSVARRRSPATQLVLVPAAVQGEFAPQSLLAAIARVTQWGGANVLIIGRGGGSREDLWAFNDERVARAVAACPIPTVSAVGHEVDITICDLVADMRAATPSVAAEMVVPHDSRVVARLASLGAALSRGAALRVDEARERLRRASNDAAVAGARGLERRKRHLDAIGGRLHALSPLATLARGYAVVRGEDGRAVTSVRGLARGAHVEIEMRDGVARATIDDVRAANAMDEESR